MNENVTKLVIIALIVLAAIVVIALIMSAMRKRKQEANRTRAAELREEARSGATGIPEAQVRADQEAAEAEQRRIEAEKAERRAAESHQQVAQQQAQHEEKVRAADRLDPDVNHRAKDYTPQTAAAETTPTSERYDASGRTTTEPATSTGSGTGGDPDTIFDSGDQHEAASHRATDTTATETTGTGTTSGRHHESSYDGTYLDDHGVLRNADGTERPVPGDEDTTRA